MPADLDLDTDGGCSCDPTQPRTRSAWTPPLAGRLHRHRVGPSAGWSLTAPSRAPAPGLDSSTNLGTRTATHRPRRRRDRHLHLHQHQGRQPDGRQGDRSGERSAGLRLQPDRHRRAGRPRPRHRWRRRHSTSQDTFSLNAAAAGAYTVIESAVAGWSLTALACTGAGADSSTNLGTRTATLDIDAGETVICTFTNTKDASLTVVKVTDPATDPQDFDFNLTGTGVPADLDLDTDGGDAPLPSQDTFSLTAAAAGRLHGHRVGRQAGWSLTALACTGAGADSSTNLGIARPPSTSTPARRDLHLHQHQGRQPDGRQGDRPGERSAGLRLQPDRHRRAGRPRPRHRWRRRPPAQPGHVQPDRRRSWAPIPSSSRPSAGWSLTTLACTGAGADSSTNLGTRTATLDIDAGETVICTFTNTKDASLTVVKVTDPASDPQDFDFNLTGTGVPADLDLDTDGGDATLPSQDTFSLTAASWAPTRHRVGRRRLVADRPRVHRCRGDRHQPRDSHGHPRHRRRRDRDLHLHQHQGRQPDGRQGDRPGDAIRRTSTST